MKVAISGGTGLLGKAITKILLEQGHEVVILSRSNNNNSDKRLSYAVWNPAAGELDFDAMSHVDGIINLAGAPVAQRWTASNKKAILDSRVDSTKCLVNYVLHQPNQVKIFVSASAIGIYPSSKELMTVSSKAGKSFLSDVVVQWEKAAEPVFEKVKGSIIRIGIVLSADGGALEKMLPIFKLGIGSALGSGKQWQSWIHIDDIARLFVFALQNEALPMMNGVAPHPVNQRVFSKELAKALKKPFWAPAVPAFVLKMVLGDMAEVVLNSQKVSAKSAENSGFEFKYKEIDKALSSLFKK